MHLTHIRPHTLTQSIFWILFKTRVSLCLGYENAGATCQRCPIAGLLHRKGANFRHHGVRKPWQTTNISEEFTS